MATTRAMLNPASPAGWPTPMMRSSIWSVGSSGTLASRALTICVDRSSGRIDTSDPLNARPIGLRAVATMTASGMRFPISSVGAPAARDDSSLPTGNRTDRMA